MPSVTVNFYELLLSFDARRGRWKVITSYLATYHLILRQIVFYPSSLHKNLELFFLISAVINNWNTFNPSHAYSSIAYLFIYLFICLLACL